MTPFAVNATVPVGAVPVTVAVKSRSSPPTDGFGALATVVVGARRSTGRDDLHRQCARGGRQHVERDAVGGIGEAVSREQRPSVNVLVAGVMSTNCVSLLVLSQLPQSVSNGAATRTCAPLLG